MKTIVINTSKEAKNTTLDVLFRAPFDKDSLLWYDSELAEIGGLAAAVKSALITDTDTVDRDYQLIVLVDLYRFPRGNEINTVKLYKALVTRYISNELVGELHRVHNLLPTGVSVYFADSATEYIDLNPAEMDDNALAQQARLNREQEQSAAQRLKTDAEGNLVGGKKTEAVRPIREKTPEEKLMMELFSWTEDLHSHEFTWTLPCAAGEGTVLDFFGTFETVASDIGYSDESAMMLDIALERAMKVLEVSDGSWDTSAVTSLEFVTDHSVLSHTIHFKRENEQTLIEGFFNVFANIFLCVQDATLLTTVVDYSKDTIADVLHRAYTKYTYFADKRHVPLTFAPVEKMFAERENIVKQHKENVARRARATKQTEFRDKTPEEVAQIVMSQTTKKASRVNAVPKTGSAADKAFYELVEAVFDNYDPEIIKEQNETIAKSCLTALWNWRDENTVKDFICTLDKQFPEEFSVTDEPVESRETLMFIQETYEQERAEQINAITQFQHRLSANDNILNETKNCIIRYGELMRKGKQYLLAFIGACVAVAASVLPFIFIQLFPAQGKAIPLAITLGIIAGASALYATASGFYMRAIALKKSEVREVLETIKEASEQERKDSIAALYTYYTETVVNAECKALLWSEILRRDRDNAVKCVKRNNHLKRLKDLAEHVERFRTRMKLEKKEVSDEERDEEIKALTDGLELRAKESFFSPANQKVYNVLFEVQADEEQDQEEEGEAL